MSFLVSVDARDWSSAQAGDASAVKRIKQAIHDIRLYDHGFNPGPGDWVTATLEELERVGAVESVVVDNEFFTVPIFREPS